MTGLLAAVAAAALPVVLLGSVFGQVRRPGAVVSAVRAQGVVPRALAGPAAVAAIALEALAGLGGATALLLRLDGPMRAALGAAAALLGLYAVYAAHVARTRPGVPCGCAGASTPMTGWVAIRAAALAVLALAGALHGLPMGYSPYEVFVVGAAGLGFAVILWTLPHAMIERRSAG